jgi:serpin B
VEGLLAAQLDQWLKAMRETKVDIRIPRWKMNWREYLEKTLQDMGMKQAFTGRADFSGMNGKGGLFISQVIHQSFVEVNEEGTEAAAATTVVMKGNGGTQTIEFRADRPFVFLIRDKLTGAILFVGRLANPEK